jgi:hypothetical protein
VYPLGRRGGEYKMSIVNYEVVIIVSFIRSLSLPHCLALEGIAVIETHRD